MHRYGFPPGRVRVALSLLLACLALPALCDPPSHAPAHGWRKKHDPYYLGYTGKKWKDDYGVMQGRCDGARLGAALGAQAGAAVGAAVAGDTGEIVGAIAGVLIGTNLDQDMDAVDRGCVGHILDLGADGRAVAWTNPGSGMHYTLTPGAVIEKGGRACRSFAWASGVRQTACANSDGSWTVQGR
jgi:surface antigen